MNKSVRSNQTMQPSTEPAPEPEKKVIPVSAGCVQVGDIVIRKPIAVEGVDNSSTKARKGRVIWVHPLGRFHVVEFGEGRRAVRESFMGVSR